jgi:Na+/phosphate symporter
MRRILTNQLQAAGVTPNVDTFFDRVVKYIPVEIVSAWIAVKGIIAAAATQSKQTILWVCFAIGVVFTALFMLKQTAVPGKGPAIMQTVIATIAFAVWVFALGEPFATWLGVANQSLYGSLLLIFFTLAVGLIIPKEPT